MLYSRGCVKDSCAFIANNAKSASINLESITACSDEIGCEMSKRSYSPATWKSHPLNPQEANDFAAEWIFLVDLLNFSFWKPDDEEEVYSVFFNGQWWTGYWSLCAAINRALARGIPVTSAQWMASSSIEDIMSIFTHPLAESKGHIPMLNQRATLIKDAGLTLLCKFGGSFLNVIKMANGNIEVFINLIIGNFPSFMDISTYDGTRPVLFFKRAQILVADLWACFEGVSQGKFDNIDAITAFADYRLPQQLEAMGILKLSPEFKTLLTDHKLLSVHDERVIELRGCTVHAIELIREQINRSQGGTYQVNAILIDFYLWDTVKDRERDNSHFDQQFPFHRTRSTFY